jgi:chromosome segregation ATPase
MSSFVFACTKSHLNSACCPPQAEAAEKARADLRSVRNELAKAAADKEAAAAALEAAAARAAAAEADLQGLRAQLEGARASQAAAAEEAAMLRANLDEVRVGALGLHCQQLHPSCKM